MTRAVASDVVTTFFFQRPFILAILLKINEQFLLVGKIT